MNLVGITGFSKSGKTTVAGLLAARLSSGTRAYLARIIPFAQPIKQALSDLFDEPFYLWEDQKTKNDLVTGHTFTRRHAMQTFGTEWARNLEPDFWVRIHKQEIKHYLKASQCTVVVPDCRFEEEAKYITEQGGVIIEVLSNDTEEGEHPSEKRLDAKYISHTIFNDKRKPFDNLLTQVDDLCPFISEK